MASDLKVQSYYHIKLANPWLDKEYNVRITGIANINTLTELDPTANIKKEFFNNYNIPISKYLLLITNSTLIYVCQSIKEYDPVVIDEDNKVFIPETLIDYSETFEYIEAKRYDFDVSTGVKSFNSILDENDFLESATELIRKSVNNIDHFVADSLSVRVHTTDVLTTQDKLDDIETERSRIVDNKNMALKQNKDNIEAKERNLYRKTKEAERSYKKYEDAREQIVSQMNSINALQALNEQENFNLTKIKNNMIEIINKIRDGEYSPESFPTFDELYDEVVNGK